jgi:hypothetical protein
MGGGGGRAVMMYISSYGRGGGGGFGVGPGGGGQPSFGRGRGMRMVMLVARNGRSVSWRTSRDYLLLWEDDSTGGVIAALRKAGGAVIDALSKWMPGKMRELLQEARKTESESHESPMASFGRGRQEANHRGRVWTCRGEGYSLDSQTLLVFQRRK